MVQKVAGSNWRKRGLYKLGKIRQRNERDELCLSFICFAEDSVGVSYPNSPTATTLLETFTFNDIPFDNRTFSYRCEVSKQFKCGKRKQNKVMQHTCNCNMILNSNIFFQLQIKPATPISSSTK